MENPADETIHDLHHEVQHHAHEHGGVHMMRIALTTAVIAALAAVTGYLAGEKADEALVEQIHAADHWSYYQAKSIKSSVLSAKIDTLRELTGKPSSKSDVEKAARYEKEMEEIRGMAEEKQHESSHLLAQRTTLATGVTLFQVAIAIGAISAITRSAMLWYASLLFGGGGIFFLLKEVFFA